MNDMKKKLKISIMCMGLMFSAIHANAQWAVIDPSNLVQNIQQVISSSSTLTNMIKNVQESIKIYEQGREYYDALKSVHNIIKDARKVQRTVEMVGEITNIYVSGFNKMVSDPSFTPDELAAISAGYAVLLAESAATLAELKTIVTGGNGLSLSDKERMDVIDQVYTKMMEYRSLTLYYTNRNMGVSYLRAKKKNDAARVLSLYGNENEKYW